MKRFLTVKPIVGIVGLLFFSIALIGPIIIFIYTNKIIGIFMFLVGIYVLFKGIIYNCFLRKIEISKNGIKYITPSREHTIVWEEIGVIGISGALGGTGRQPCIYFTSGKNPVPYVTSKMLNDKFFIVNYRKSIINEVKKYWSGEIKNLYNNQFK